MKYTYKQGREARNNFEDAMKTVFKAPKTVQIKQRPKKATNARKTDASGK
jgi:hypothetical protein